MTMKTTLIRSVLKIGAGILVAKGFADESTAEIIVSGLTALVAVLWGIFDRTPPPPAVPVEKLTVPALLVASVLILSGCGSTGTVGSAYDPASGDLTGSVGVGSSNVTVTAGGGYNVNTGQPLPVTLTVTFKDDPHPFTSELLARAGAVRSRQTLAWSVTVPDVRDPNSVQFAAVRAALAEGAVVSPASSQ